MFSAHSNFFDVCWWWWQDRATIASWKLHSTGRHRNGRRPNQLKFRQARKQADMGLGEVVPGPSGIILLRQRCRPQTRDGVHGQDVKITRTTQLGFSAPAAGIACFRWRSAGQQDGRTGYMSKDKILQPLGLVVSPLSWRSAIGLPSKPSAHQRRVPEQEAEMLVVVIVSTVRWCACWWDGWAMGTGCGGRRERRSRSQVQVHVGPGPGPDPGPARWRPSPKAIMG